MRTNMLKILLVSAVRLLVICSTFDSGITALIAKLCQRVWLCLKLKVNKCNLYTEHTYRNIQSMVSYGSGLVFQLASTQDWLLAGTIALSNEAQGCAQAVTGHKLAVLATGATNGTTPDLVSASLGHANSGSNWCEATVPNISE